MLNTDPLLKQKALAWADAFDVCCMLDSNSYPDVYHQYDFLVAAGVKRELNAITGQAFDQLKAFYDAQPAWMFGLLSYDLKNELEDLHSDNTDELQFPDLYFFVPQYLVAGKDGHLVILLGDASIIETIQNTVPKQAQYSADINMESRIDKSAYLHQIDQLKEHILKGNCYEVTLCQEFFARNACIDPLFVFQQLSQHSPAPFSGYFKIHDQYVLSASPERFLCKRGQRLISQPIKGTAARSADAAIDEQYRLNLEKDQKERAENVMIVDLVRNDLTRSASPATVVVDELFGIYSFPQVHQMISTISCELQPGLHFVNALKNTFPMGSMTGAPKIKAMQLIEEFEGSKRGAYSGAIGYIDPRGDFDFNVTIRTILYQASRQYLSFQVGGAITFNSDPEKEYEECLLKASSMLQALKGQKKTSS